MRRLVVTVLAVIFATAAMAGPASAYTHSGQDRLLKRHTKQIKKVRSNIEVLFLLDHCGFEISMGFHRLTFDKLNDAGVAGGDFPTLPEADLSSCEALGILSEARVSRVAADYANLRLVQVAAASVLEGR